MAILLQLAALVSGAADHERVLKVRHGEVVFHEDTIVGENLLRRGRYGLEHRQDHVVVLTELNWLMPRAVIWRPNPVRLELRGELKPLAAPARGSEVHVVREGCIGRVTMILFKGESTAHAFRAGLTGPKEESG